MSHLSDTHLKCKSLIYIKLKTNKQTDNSFDSLSVYSRILSNKFNDEVPNCCHLRRHDWSLWRYCSLLSFWILWTNSLFFQTAIPTGVTVDPDRYCAKRGQQCEGWSWPGCCPGMRCVVKAGAGRFCEEIVHKIPQDWKKGGREWWRLDSGTLTFDLWLLDSLTLTCFRFSQVPNGTHKHDHTTSHWFILIVLINRKQTTEYSLNSFAITKTDWQIIGGRLSNQSDIEMVINIQIFRQITDHWRHITTVLRGLLD